MGQLADCEWHEWTSAPRSKTFDEVLGDLLSRLNVLVLYGLPLGHGDSTATRPLVVRATLDADALTPSVDDPALRPRDESATVTRVPAERHRS